MGYPTPDVVVVLPGITGSELAKGNRIVWGWSGGVLARNLITAGGSLRRDLAIPEDSPTAESLDDGIVATRLLPDLHLVPGLWKVDGYGVVAEYLKQQLELREEANYFPFPYDWRRDNRAIARRLARQANDWLSNWRKASSNPQAKLILVAHSMGGLIARYFLEVLEGWRITRALITFGTPYAGSLNAVDSLVNGLEKVGIDLTDLVRKFYSLHQLLPTYPCWDVNGDGQLSVLRGRSLPGIDAVRLSDAVAFHDEIESAAKHNATDEEYVTRGYEVYPIVGYNQSTRRSFQLDGATAEFLESTSQEAPDGDGTVPRTSATPTGFKLTRAMFASTKHAALQNSAAALAHIVGVLSSIDYRVRGKQILLPAQLSLDVRDIYSSSAPAIIRARPTRNVSVLRIEIADAATGRTVEQALMQPDTDGWYLHAFRPASNGGFRVVVSGEGALVEPASDVFEYLDLVAGA